MASITNTSLNNCEVWIIRHGERVDETDQGDQWYYGTPKLRRFDPYLTDIGKSQAQQSAKTLHQIIQNIDPINTNNSSNYFFDTVYCSPMQRCLSTAHEVTSTLNKSNDSRFHCINGIKVVPGLGECAAAGRKHGVDNLTFLSPQEMMNLCPGTILSETNCWDNDVTPRTYESALNWIVNHELNKSTSNLGRKRILIVAHREAIRDLTGSRARIPYCGIALFQTSLQSQFSFKNKSPSFDENIMLDDMVDSYVIEENGANDSDNEGSKVNKYDYQVINVFDPYTAAIVPLF
jgi:broad specificity phosphatase PhoE